MLKNTERTRKYSLYQFSTKLTLAVLVKTCALFAGNDQLHYIIPAKLYKSKKTDKLEKNLPLGLRL